MPLTQVLCNEPPYGMITAIDMHTRKVVWEHPLGTARANGPFGLATGMPMEIGTPNNGGPIITAGGLVFIAAATDNLIRAIDIRTGEVVWTDVLPAGGQATPMTYSQNGRQYLVIVAGGHHFMRTPPGDYVVAYALPQSSS
jgi:quinoprotein glucose dehydrogenase